MRRPFLVLALLAMIAMVLTVQPAAAQRESLLIGPGDLIQVDVLDTPEMEQQVRVTDEGNAPLAYVGNVKVGGMTPGAAAEAIQLLLISKNVMKHPQVTVRVQEYSTQDVSVLGQVHTPGAYPLTTPQPVLRVLSLAGGVTDLADRQVTIKRHGSPEQLTYMLSNDPQKMLTDMVMVYPGDIVMVPNCGPSDTAKRTFFPSRSTTPSACSGSAAAMAARDFIDNGSAPGRGMPWTLSASRSVSTCVAV